ncbi:MFS transporter [Actinoplanes sichuanensis]|uniref:MFS transporter n=1 Tax=Actinoplanes sichuanensis TaxID=512349 RepID=A0ABW4A7G8_9ACTN|nr:MFS transporter [Actinoplanes sichuanensis]BEL03663.1 MFS transporter [Actinoplanes sichuanensis]
MDLATKETSEVRRVVFSSYLGSTIEFYDFLLYGTAAALVFPAVFFSGLDPLTSVLFSFGTFAAGYLARPVGGILFGHFGDRIGRKRMLVVTMFLMGVASFLIGLIPSAAVIGGWSAVLLITLRVVQGIAVGGEWGGAALMALEHSGGSRRGLAASFVNAGAPSGAVLGSLMLGLFSLLPPDQFLSWGWRIPFLMSAILLVIGLWVRASVSESPVFLRALDEAARKPPSLPILSVLRRPRALILTTFGAGAAFAFQVGMATFAQTYAVSHGTARPSVLLGFSVASFLAIFAVIGAGWLSDRFGRRPVLLAGAIGWGLLAFPLFKLWGSGNGLLVFTGFAVGLGLQSLMYGPLGAFISEQFGTGARYTGASLGYQLATLIGGGFTPAILASLYAGTGGTTITPVATYLIIAAAVSAIAVVLIREGRRHDLTTVTH